MAVLPINVYFIQAILQVSMELPDDLTNISNLEGVRHSLIDMSKEFGEEGPPELEIELLLTHNKEQYR